MKSFQCILLFLFGCSLTAFTFADCSSDSKEVQYAKNINQERLALLYNQTKQLTEADVFLPKISSNSEKAPKEFNDLEYINVHLIGSTARFMLQGCFDHFVIIRINGINSKQEASITLEYGEGPDFKQEILWPKK